MVIVNGGLWPFMFVYWIYNLYLYFALIWFSSHGAPQHHDEKVALIIKDKKWQKTCSTAKAQY